MQTAAFGSPARSDSAKQWDVNRTNCFLAADAFSAGLRDLGCGDGVLTAKLASMGCHVIGVDASAAQIHAARKRDLDARIMNVLIIARWS